MEAKRRPNLARSMLSLACLFSTLVTTSSIVGCGGGSGANQAIDEGVRQEGVNFVQPESAKVFVTPNSGAIPGNTTPSWAKNAGQIITDFNSASNGSLTEWSFSNGAEFPGASGRLIESAGSDGNAAKLVYDFTCGASPWNPYAGRSCGRYVSMNLPQLAQSLVASENPAISFDVRNTEATAAAAVRVVDRTGQTLHFTQLAVRPIENPYGTNWQRVLTPISRSNVFWGGANDGIMHPPIRQISILAGDVPLIAPVGALEVDNIRYLNSANSTFNLYTDASINGDIYPSTYIGRIGVVWRPRYGYAVLDKMIAAGLSLVRMDLNWEAVESNGKFDFSYYSNIASELAKRNVKILWILDYGHKDHGGITPLNTSDQAAFAEFGRQAAITFKGKNVIGYEVWNEPNWSPFWPTPDANAYGSLLKKTIDAIRTVDSTTKISSGGTAGADFDFVMALLRTGKAAQVDAIGLHPYRKTSPETYSSQVAIFKQMLKAVGSKAEIWDTEWGYSSYGDIGPINEFGTGRDPRATRRQAVLNLRKVLTQIALNTPISILFESINDGSNPTDRENNFGLINEDLTDKPSIIGLRTLKSAQNGRVLKGVLSDVPPWIHVIRWDGPSDKVFAIWSDAPPGVSTTITPPQQTSSIALWDGTAPKGITANNQFDISEESGPVFVTIKNH